MRRVTVLVTILLVVGTLTTGWAVTGTESVQDERASFDVTNISAPPSAPAGETITISATISYDADAGSTATAADDGTATAADDGTATAADDGTATAADDGTATAADDGTATAADDGTATAADDGTATADTGTTTATAAETTEATATDATSTTSGDEAVTQSVEFRVAGDVVERQAVTLAPGESTTVTFEFDTTGVLPGTYIHGVYTDQFGAEAALVVTTATPSDGGENVTATPTDGANETATPTDTDGETTTTATPTETGTPTPTATSTATPDEAETTATTTESSVTPTPMVEGPSLDVRNLSAPDSVVQGETVTVTAEAFLPIDADTDGNVTQSVEFRVSGDVVDEQDVTLAPGESTTVTFELDTTDVEPGVYVHSVFTRDFGEVATLSVTAENATNETATETPMPTNETTTETPTPSEEGTATPGEATGTETAAGTETTT